MKLATLLALLGLLPIIIPVFYIDGKPIYIGRVSDAGPIYVYIDYFERLRVAYQSVLLTSTGILVTSLIWFRVRKPMLLELLLSFTALYTTGVTVLAFVLEPFTKLEEEVKGVKILVQALEVEYTPIYWMIDGYILTIASLGISLALTLHVVMKYYGAFWRGVENKKSEIRDSGG